MSSQNSYLLHSSIVFEGIYPPSNEDFVIKLYLISNFFSPETSVRVIAIRSKALPRREYAEINVARILFSGTIFFNKPETRPTAEIPSLRTIVQNSYVLKTSIDLTLV